MIPCDNPASVKDLVHPYLSPNQMIEGSDHDNCRRHTRVAFLAAHVF